MTVYWRGTARRGAYYVDFRADGRRYVKRVGPDRKAAEDAETLLRARALESRYATEFGLRRPGRPPTLAEYLRERFVPLLRLRRSTKHSREVLHSQATQLTAMLGPLRLDHLSAPIITATGQRWLGGRNPNYLRDLLKLLRRALAQAATDGYPALPAREVPVPASRPYLDRILTDDRREDAALLAAVRRPVVRDMLRLSLMTGLRRQELAGLRVGHVDVARRRVRFVQPKTQRTKTVPLLEEALAILRPRMAGRPDEAHIFLNEQGGAFTPDTLGEAFRVARNRAKIRGVTLHGLRHTVATRLLRAGADLATVGDILGHAPPYRQTLRYVAHVDEARKRAALERGVGGDNAATRSPRKGKNT